MKNGSTSSDKPHQERSLAESYPEVAAEWAFEKNVPLTPNDVCAASHMKVWWICKGCGRAWAATVFSRTHHGTGCPYDSGKLIPPEACMATRYPELAKEWDDKRNGNLRPDQVASYSYKKAWWKCPNCGNSWSATVANRVRGVECPCCKQL